MQLVEWWTSTIVIAVEMSSWATDDGEDDRYAALRLYCVAFFFELIIVQCK